MLRLARHHLETDDLTLHRPAPADAAELAAAGNHRGIASMLASMPHPFGADQARQWIDSTARAPKGAHAFIIRWKQDGNRIIGTCGYGPNARTGETVFGYWITPDARNQGLATQAAGAVLTHAFCLAMVDCVSADVQKVNPASRRVMDKLGFSQVGERSCYSQGTGREEPTWHVELNYQDWLARQAA